MHKARKGYAWYGPFLPPTRKKGGEHQEADWILRDKDFTDDYIRMETRDGIMPSIRENIEDKDKDYWTLPHE